MYLLHSIDIPEAYLEGLEAMLAPLERIPVPASRDVYGSISSHPDIFIFSIGPDRAIYSPSLPDALISRIKGTGTILIKADAAPQGRYPKTAILNAAKIGKYIFHNIDITDKVIKEAAEAEGLSLIHVNQGYSRCSIVPVGEAALITSDRGIMAAAVKTGLDVGLISSGSVILPGEDHGSIGGASGCLPDGDIVFLGDITSHPDGRYVEDFIKRSGKRCLYLPDIPLFDAGSLIFTK